jgi:glycosyltransferase involved in cell wall biosynthesis
MKLISFVIPTYNFAKFIGETLDSILQEDSSFYEIIIYDGFSTDDTKSVVRWYSDKYDCIRYIRSKKRNNIDIDLNTAISEATSRYIWTMSADDLLVKGWLSYFLSALENNQSDIYLFPAIHCDQKMNKLYKYPIASFRTPEDLKVTVSNNSDYLSYLQLVRTSEGLFSFCSSCVVDRVKIQNTDLLLEANGTCWRYAARIIQMSLTYPCSIFLTNNFIIHKRGENDSFGKNGIIRRLDIAITQWVNAIRLIKKDPLIQSFLIKKVHSDIGFSTLFYIKQLHIKNQQDRIDYKRIVNTKYPAKSFFSWILLKTPESNLLRFFFILLLKLHFDKLFKIYRIYIKFR